MLYLLIGCFLFGCFLVWATDDRSDLGALLVVVPFVAALWFVAMLLVNGG